MSALSFKRTIYAAVSSHRGLSIGGFLVLNCDFFRCACFMAAPTLGRTLLTQWEDDGLATKYCDTKICLVGWYFHMSFGLRFPSSSCLCTWKWSPGWEDRASSLWALQHKIMKFLDYRSCSRTGQQVIYIIICRRQEGQAQGRSSTYYHMQASRRTSSREG